MRRSQGSGPRATSGLSLIVIVAAALAAWLAVGLWIARVAMEAYRG